MSERARPTWAVVVLTPVLALCGGFDPPPALERIPVPAIEQLDDPLRVARATVFDASEAARIAGDSLPVDVDPLTHVTDASTVRAIAADISRGRCDAMNDIVLADIEQTTSDDRARGAILFVRAELLRCAGMTADSDAAYLEAARLNPRLAPVLVRRLALRPGSPFMALPEAERGGYGVVELWTHRAVRGQLSDLEAREIADVAAATRPARWLADDLEALAWQFSPGPQRVARRLEMLDQLDSSPVRDARLGELLESDAPLGEFERQQVIDVLLDRLAESPRSDRRGLLLLDVALGAGIVSAEEHGAIRALASGTVPTVMGAAEAPRSIELSTLRRRVTALRRDDRDPEALELVASFLDSTAEPHPVDLLVTCTTLSGNIGDGARQRACWDELAGLADDETLISTGIPVVADAIAEGRLDDALRVVGSLTERGRRGRLSPIDEARAAYWTARVHVERGDVRAARRWFAVAFSAAPVSYWGVMADAWQVRLGDEPKWPIVFRSLLDSRYVRWDDPRLYAARELEALGFARLAGDELLYQAELFGPSLPQAGALAAIALAERGEFRRAMWSAVRHGRIHDQSLKRLAGVPGSAWRAAYPVMFTKEFGVASLSSGVPRSMLLAIARRESNFDPTARSPVGARGLMQVIPTTATFVRSLLARVGIDAEGSLEAPGANALIGAAFIQYLSQRYGGCVEPITAAYSAGPARADRWMRETNDVWSDVWLERMPYPVVRDYAREIVVSRAIYAVMLGEHPVDPLCAIGEPAIPG